MRTVVIVINFNCVNVDNEVGCDLIAFRHLIFVNSFICYCY